MLANRLACIALAALLPAAASAQSVSFWLAALPGNIQGCIAADPQFTREHTFTLKDGEAELASPGGINTKLKLVKPNVYESDYQFGHLHVPVVADLSVTPRTRSTSPRSTSAASGRARRNRHV